MPPATGSPPVSSAIEVTPRLTLYARSIGYTVEQLTTANPEIPINDWAVYIPWQQAQQEWLGRLWDKWLRTQPSYVLKELRDGPSSHGRQGMDRVFDKWLEVHEAARPNPGDLVRIEGEDDLFCVAARDLGVIGVIVNRLTSEGGERCIIEKYLHKVSPRRRSCHAATHR